MADESDGVVLFVKFQVGYIKTALADEVTHLSEAVPFGCSSWRPHSVPLVHHPRRSVVSFAGNVPMHGL